MACIGSQFPEKPPSAFLHKRRPALLPPDCSLSPTETEDLIRTRLHQPVIPPPDPRIFQTLKQASPEPANPPSTEHPSRVDDKAKSPLRSPTCFTKSPQLPAAIARDPHRRAAYLKARAHHARDRKLQQLLCDHGDPDAPIPSTEIAIPHANIIPVAPKTMKKGLKHCLPIRKHCALVIDEELRDQLEARADTPHLSEGLPGENTLQEDVMASMLETDKIVSAPDGA